MILLPWPGDMVDSVWELVEPYLIKPVALHGGYSIGDVREAVRARHMQLLVVAREDNSAAGAIITEIHQYPRKRTCFVLFIGGKDLAKWPVDKVTAWARDTMGCSEIAAIGRKGLKHWFPEEDTGFIFYRRGV